MKEKKMAKALKTEGGITGQVITAIDRAKQAWESGDKSHAQDIIHSVGWLLSKEKQSEKTSQIYFDLVKAMRAE
jgi:hypothetical protein